MTLGRFLVQEPLEGALPYPVDSSESHSFQLAAFDVFQHREGVDLQDLGHLFRGVYFFVHFFVFMGSTPKRGCAFDAILLYFV